MKKNKILITDSSLRDGNHAVAHQLSCNQVIEYCKLAETAGIPIVEVGHGNGLGASSLLVGKAAESDFDLLSAARSSLKKTKLAVHVIPGFATMHRDLQMAVDIGVDVFRIASHCTEADITQRHINFCRGQGRDVIGVLMMSHMANKEILLQEALKMEAYGAEGVILMDSAGNYMPSDVENKVSFLVNNLLIPVGFHAHNNLLLSVANSLVAVEAGAKFIDACSRGFGAGAGNTPLEVIVPVLQNASHETGIDLYKALELADHAEKWILESMPKTSSASIVSGLAGVFSGFLKPVNRVADLYDVDSRDLFLELGKRKVVAGQEDIIIEVAEFLSKRKNLKK